MNRIIFEDREVTKIEMSMAEAKAKGALMFFGDKYGDRVRVVTVGDAESVELCGGTHLERAATIGALRITSESAIGSGVRRVEAVTGAEAVEAARQQEDLVLELSREVGVPVTFVGVGPERDEYVRFSPVPDAGPARVSQPVGS